LIFFKKPEGIQEEVQEGEEKPYEQQDITVENFTEKLNLPHNADLMKFFESFHMLKYPKEPIQMLRKKCKFTKSNPL
jgi:hypothetical protein